MQLFNKLLFRNWNFNAYYKQQSFIFFIYTENNLSDNYEGRWEGKLKTQLQFIRPRYTTSLLNEKFLPNPLKTFAEEGGFAEHILSTTWLTYG